MLLASKGAVMAWLLTACVRCLCFLPISFHRDIKNSLPQCMENPILIRITASKPRDPSCYWRGGCSLLFTSIPLTLFPTPVLVFENDYRVCVYLGETATECMFMYIWIVSSLTSMQAFKDKTFNVRLGFFLSRYPLTTFIVCLRKPAFSNKQVLIFKVCTTVLML